MLAGGTGVLDVSRSTPAVLLLFGTIGLALLASGAGSFPVLHTILDTSCLVLSAVLALLLWDMSKHSTHALSACIAPGFAITALFESLHVAVPLDWSGSLAAIAHSQVLLRPATWSVTAYLLPLGILCSLWYLRNAGRRTVGLALFLTLLGTGLLALFYSLSGYIAPLLPGLARPALLLVPVLWAMVVYQCWRLRESHRIVRMLALMGMVLLPGSTAMLFSYVPHDAPAMFAHLSKVAGELTLLLSMVQMASVDAIERIRAEQNLLQLNTELEQRVSYRTQQIEAANQALKNQIRIRQQQEINTHAQLLRLRLLHQITLAICQRQDLTSIFQVMIGSVEADLPIDFGCVCNYHAAQHTLVVSSLGPRSQVLSRRMALAEGTPIVIDTERLSPCIRGEVLYEPELRMLEWPLARVLCAGGLNSLVTVPLRAEDQLLGVFVAARHASQGFSSADCEFLHHLSDHVGVAARQAQLYSSLQSAYDELRDSQRTVVQQERLRVLGQMASGVAHDINNAISPVSLYTESLLNHEPGLSERGHSHLTIIRRAIEDVAQTVTRMRDFCRPRAAVLELSQVDTNRVVQQVLELTRARWRDLPQQHGIVITVLEELCPDTRWILGAESDIRDALTNLILNAIDAMPQGGTLTLRTLNQAAREAVQKTAALVQVEICDTGVGMDETTRQQCLEPFFTTKGVRGTGLGLAMVHGMAQRHDALIEIDSLLGQGTTIRLLFPAIDAVAVVASAVQATSQPATTPLRILVIDDDPTVLTTVLDTLQIYGHTVVAADGGQAGIDAFTTAHQCGERFSLVITDLGMPHVDGRKVAAAVKGISPMTPVLMLTGWGKRLVEDDQVPPCVDRLLSKPPSLQELRCAISELTAATVLH